MTDPLCVVLCAPDYGSAYSSSDIQDLTAGLSDALNGADVSFGSIGIGGAGLSGELTRISSSFDGPIVCIPTTPFAGDVQKRIIPTVIASQDGMEGRLRLARDAGVDPAMLRAAQSRVQDALAAVTNAPDPQDTLLLIVGHGSIDADANGNLMKMSRMIWEGLGFGWAEVTYVDGAFPSVEDTMARAGRLGFTSIVILPYAIIGDQSFDSIADRVSACLDSDEIPCVIGAEPLGANPNVVQVLADRVREAVAGDAMNSMNCQLCTYREQVLAIESKEDDHHHHHHHDHDHQHDD